MNLKNNRGSTLAWVMIVMLVASIFIFAASLVQLRLTGRVVIENHQKQAYLSAKSACDAVAYPLLQLNQENGIKIDAIDPLVNAAKAAAQNGITTTNLEIDFAGQDMGEYSVKIVPYPSLTDHFEIIAKAVVEGQEFEMGLVLKYVEGIANAGVLLGTRIGSGDAHAREGVGNLRLEEGNFVMYGDLGLKTSGQGNDRLEIYNANLFIDGKIWLQNNEKYLLKMHWDAGHEKAPFHLYAKEIVSSHNNIQIDGREYNGTTIWNVAKPCPPLTYENPVWTTELKAVPMSQYENWPMGGGDQFAPGYYLVKSTTTLDLSDTLDSDSETAIVTSKDPTFIRVMSGQTLYLNGNIPSLTFEKEIGGRPQQVVDQDPRLYIYLEDGAKVQFAGGTEYCVAIFGEESSTANINCDNAATFYGQLIAGAFSNTSSEQITLHLQEPTGGEATQQKETFTSVRYNQR